ncbi:MAG TPA: hypothetical protein VGB77_13705, partial [Abditibacteriaceae bacterium]
GIANEQTLTEFPLYIREVADLNAVNTLMEQARRDDTQRKAELARQEKLRAYLFDLGTKEHVGTLQLGGVRRFTPVLAADVYREESGYGFFPQAPTHTFDMHWVNGALNRDGVRLSRDSRFQFRAAPGRYRLRAGFASPGNVTLRGVTIADQANNTFDFKSDNPIIDSVVVVGNEPVALESNHADLSWVTLVEETGSPAK